MALMRKSAVLFAGALAVLAAGEAPAAERLAGPFPAEVLRVIDGDTLAVRVPVWLGQELDVHVRLRGIDTPEVHGKCRRERDLAAEATALLAKAATPQVTLRNVEGDKYFGRVEADVTAAGGADLSATMLASGLARPYDGGKRGEWCGVASLGG